jgi:hypothetical protein
VLSGAAPKCIIAFFMTELKLINHNINMGTFNWLRTYIYTAGLMAGSTFLCMGRFCKEPESKPSDVKRVSTRKTYSNDYYICKLDVMESGNLPKS